MFSSLEKVLMPVADKLGRNKVLLAIRNGFLITVPLIIVGSIFLLIANFPIEAFGEFMEGIFGPTWTAPLGAVSTSIIRTLGLFSCFGIGYSYAKEKGINAIAGAVVAVVAFFILSDQTHLLFTNEAGDAFRGFSLETLGSSGLFVSMITAIISVAIFSSVVKKGWVIRMPEGVPPAVTDSFAAIIPSALVMTTFFLVRIAFMITPFDTAQNFVFTVLQTPLVGLGQSFAFEVIYQFLSTIFWFFGINGPAVTNTIFSPIHTILTNQNQEAYQLGQALPNIFTGPFSDFFCNFGGGGSTLSLVILMTTICKSKRIKQLGRLSIVPGFFGINEPIIFGLPIILNPLLIVPFILVPCMNTILSTLATMGGILPYTTGVQLPWSTPIFFSGMISTGSIFAGFFQLFLLALGCLVYYPFIKMLDKQYLHEEEEAANHIEVEELDDISFDELSFD